MYPLNINYSACTDIHLVLCATTLRVASFVIVSIRLACHFCYTADAQIGPFVLGQLNH